ncbi:hypothetical protein [uncultured Microscilla sp.]|uniref:hypothetical protein n=1 Tax=uncultured Microscilla sp. TaxID=432653 RepID=UPI00262D7056|nr:hypothetical protein [uncultured Microscilla sp.]
MTFTKKIYHLIIISFMFSLVSCGYGKYNASSSVPDQKVDYDNSRVYGDGKDAKARQTKETYPTPENAGDRVNKIKDKLYGSATTVKAKKIETVDSTEQLKADSTQVDSSKAN